MKRIILIILAILIIGLGTWFAVYGLSSYRAQSAEREKTEFLNKEIEQFLDSRRDEREKSEPADPFGKDEIARVLVIGLDRRVGQVDGHCDAIQLITIDREKQEVTITAVPRGTYSPLPPGGKYLSSDYYVSKACSIGGLEYGIGQIEKILGAKADYLVVLGFSEALGIFRNLDLPTAETLEWLRQRQGYAIGEPQRAHNHSTFIKQMMIKFIPKKSSVTDVALQYILYKTVKTDLSFTEVQALTDALSAMDFTDHPERIRLVMRPAYTVQDISYAEEYLGEYLDKMINPIKGLLSKDDYSGVTEGAAQEKLLEIIDEKKNDSEFVLWAFENNLWLQIEDDEKRLAVQYEFLTKYLLSLSEKDQRESVIADYILEMEYYGEEEWAGKGKELLAEEVGQ
ncbi:LCP family protein [Candidatus Falkowbacteria bacterium]|nr:LCP family protein [Candidatus Falkowbacteria bacterium]